MALLALVQLDDLLRVDGEALVRVHHHAEEAGVSLQTNKSKNDVQNQDASCNNNRFLIRSSLSSPIVL